MYMYNRYLLLFCSALTTGRSSNHWSASIVSTVTSPPWNRLSNISDEIWSKPLSYVCQYHSMYKLEMRAKPSV